MDLDKKHFKEMLLYLLPIILAFYVMPFVITDTGSGILVMLNIIPIVCLFSSFLYGMKHSFDWIFSMIVMLLFVPTIFIFYNGSASIYILIYGALSMLGNLLGSLFYKSKNTK